MADQGKLSPDSGDAPRAPAPAPAPASEELKIAIEHTDQNGSSSSDSETMIYTPPDSDSDSDSEMSSTPGHAGKMDPSTANISVREYIYFLPYPLPPGTPVPYSTGLPERNPLGLPPQQFEPTSTLVLTSPLRTFVDVRVFKPLSRDDPAALPNHGQPDRLDWAFAGFSTSKCVVLPEHASREHREDVTHSTWNHWVDSRYPAGSSDIPIDEGDMYPISRDLTLEHGHAFHPSLRAHKSHEEMWRDVPVISTPATGLKFCIVLRVKDDAQKLRGMIVRIGQFCQGISMNGGACTVERWQWTAEAEEKEANGVPDKNLGWKRTIRIGNHFLPCAATFRPELLSVGGRVKYHTADWKVEECWQWA